MSSIKSTKEPIPKEDQTKIRQLIELIENEPQAYDFLEPVDYIGLGLDDYPAIIKNPMDISTIKKNMKNNKYSTTQEILNDIQLIWDNCKTYNMEGSDIYKLAVFCEKFTKKNIDKLFKKPVATAAVAAGIVSNSASKSAKTKEKPVLLPSTPAANTNTNISEVPKEDRKEPEIEYQDEEGGKSELSLQERVILLERVKKLSNDGLASLVRLIQKECPSSIEDLDSEKLQIRLDIVNKKTHDQINQLIDTFLRVRETNQENLGQKKGKN